MLHGYQKKIDGFLSDTKSDSTYRKNKKWP
jgi:hypothetical protein